MTADPSADQPPPDQWNLPLGYDSGGQLVEANLPTLPHLLVGGGHDWQRQQIFAAWLAKALTADPERLPSCVVPLATPEVMRLLCPDLPGVEAPPGCSLAEARTMVQKVSGEMERRYRDFARIRVRHIWAHQQLARDEPSRLRPIRGEFRAPDTAYLTYPRKWLPLLIVVIPEIAWLADSEEAMHCLLRITQCGRASGVHLIVGCGLTRPSGLMNHLFRSRLPALGFKTRTRVESYALCDCEGAELLDDHTRIFSTPSSRYPVKLFARPPG